MGVRLLSNLYLLFINTIVIALWVLGMINACHSMWMSAGNYSMHSLFFETIYSLKGIFFIRHSDWVSRFIFYSISLKFEFFLRTTSKFHFPATYRSLFISFYVSTIEESTQRYLFDGSYWCIRY